MDIYQRFCKKDIIIPEEKDDEEEIFDAESAEVQEEEQIEEVEEPVNIHAVQVELECMKRRIQQLQLKLKIMDMDECPDEPCVDYEVELTCSENKDICALQKAHYKLQCQINELVRCCSFAKEQIADLRQRLCDKAREILQLQKAVCLLNTWKNKLEHEAGVCIERFEYLKHVKAEWADVEEKIHRQRKTFGMLEESFVPKVCFVQDKKNFICAIGELRDLFDELYKMQLEKFSNLEQRLDKFMQEAKAATEKPAKKKMSQASVPQDERY